MTPEFIDKSADIWGVATAILALLTAIAGMLAWRFATWSADGKGEELKKYQTDAGVAISQANDRAAQATLETEKLKGQLAWRTLDKQTREQLALALVLNPKKGYVSIDFVANDPESQYLAMQYWQIFDFTGWHATLRSVPFMDLAFGMFVPDSPNSPEVQDIRSVLTAAHVPFSTKTPLDPSRGNGLPSGLARLIVGSKVPPQ